MKGKKIRQRLLSSALSATMVLSMVSPVYANPEAPAAAPTMEDVVSIQAFTDETMYGTGVVEVAVTYKDGVDLSGLTADSYVLEDRGSLNPDFGQIAIAGVEVEGQTAVLAISDASQATEANKMVYTGDNKEGSRQRNAFGIYCTGAWYYDENGVIHYGSDDNDAYENNTTKMGYQARETLELKLRHAGEEAGAEECLATDKGQYNAEGKWLETVDRQIGEGKFQNLYDLKIPSTAAGAEDGTGDDYVQGYYYIPENYDPANGIVFTLQGQGISYWKLADGCDDAGTGFMYDSATASWADNGAIVVNIHDRSTACPGGYTETYDFVIDDVNVMKYFLETYDVAGEIVLQGNSRGTMASDVIIKALAGRPYSPAEQGMGYQGEKPKTLDKSVYDFNISTFICQNGSFGGTIWEDDDFKAVAETGMRAWIFDGEQDTNNIETYAKYRELMAAEGMSEQWIDENVRLTGLTSNLFYPWGESDHSVTRINGWYFDDAAYYGPDLTIGENGEIVYNTKLEGGDTYVLEGRGSAATNSKAGYEYVVYDELFQDWALKNVSFEDQADLTVNDIESIQAYTDETFYGTGVVEVVVTYKDGVDLSEVTAEDYILEDRGSLNPDFGEVKIESAEVNGQVVTLKMSNGTAATEDNKLIYSGANKEGSRVRNAFGIYCTGAWYYDENGVIHYGKDDTDAYENNTTGMGYQARETLELKLRHAGEEEGVEECLATDKGQYNAEGKWLETVDRQFGENGFQNLYDLQIPSTAAGAADGTGDDYVQGYYYVPENYDPANGIVFTLQGQGISYWKLADGCDDAGTGIMYDSATTSWADNGAIVVNIHDRSTACPGGYEETYDFVVDDVTVMKYFLEKYGVTGEIVLQGNSRGTMASDVIIKALVGRPYEPMEQKRGYEGEKTKLLDTSKYNFTIDTYVCQNGSFGGTIWEEEDFKAIAKTGMRAWIFDGEQDTDNIETYAQYKELLAAEGKSAEWIAENVRLTGYTSQLYYPWGESDHSTTRINGWYFDEAAYYGPDLTINEKGEIVYGTKLNDGDTYTLQNLAGAATKEGYEYVVYDELFQEWAVKGDAEEKVADIDDITVLEKDFSQAAQLPLTGYFTKNVDVDGVTRTAKVYIAPETSVRDYFTIVAVPDGVDTEEFLETEGWFNLADEKGEGLYVLEPGAEGWGTAEEEAAYVNAAIGFIRSGNNANKVTVLSTFGEFYLAGYGKGAAALELWAAANPILVIAQTYVGGESAGADALANVSSTPYTGKSSNGDISDVLAETLEKVGIAGEAAPKDLAVPTVLAGYTGSEDHWKAANNCVEEAVDGVFYQDIDAANYSTDYANGVRKAQGETTGLSQVKVCAEAGKAADIYNYMAQYTRYDTTFAYSNALAERLDYTAARVAAQKDALDGAKEVLKDGTELWAMEDQKIEGHGTVQVGVVAFADNNEDGKVDPREYLMYVPEGFEGKEIPVLMVWPGNTQTDGIFMDSTLWWQVAEEKGIALFFVCETYNANACSVSHANNVEFYNALVTLMNEKIDGVYAELDMTRLYSTGQSAGSIATQTLAIQHPEFYAAVGSTSAAPAVTDPANAMIPTMIITGQMDVADIALGFPSAELQRWAPYMLEVNGFEPVFSAETATGVAAVDSRHPELYSWARDINGVNVPLVQWGQCLLRPHNCYPSDMPIIWDFMEHFSMVDGVRYYSASAFAEDDAVALNVEVVEPVEKQDQTITTKADSYLLAYGHKAYSLKAATTGDGELTFSSNNKKVATVDKNGKVTIVGTGKATITIKASETESYNAATKKVVIRVVPKKAVLKGAVSPKKGQLKIAVKKDAMASGYMVQYATNKSFKGFKTVVLNKTSMTKVTIKGMKAGKYYVRVCAYKSIGGNKYCGAYSSAVKVKVK